MLRRLRAIASARSFIGGIAALLSILVSPPSLAESRFEMIETTNVRLIYPAISLGYIAPYTARCYENSLRFHKEIWDYQSSDKMTVILADGSDYGNAGVWVNPRNGMLVQIAPVNFVYETGPSNERMNFTMHHEITHLIALDGAAGSDRFCRALMRGKVRQTSEHPESILWSWACVPRRSGPRWFHEGIATFLETWMAGGLGRTQGPYDEMVFRSMVRDGTRFYDPLGLESEGTKVDFQVGVNAYLYGARFLAYLAFQYSPEHLLRWVNRVPGSKRDYREQFAEVFGKPLEEGWNEWVRWEKGFQEANLESVRQFPTTPYHDLSPHALGSVSRAFVDPSSRTLYVGAQYPGTVAHIAALSLDRGTLREVREVKGPALYFVCSLAWDPDNKTLFYTSDNTGWRDLRALDPATGRDRILIKDARIGDLAFNRADRSLWGVRHFNGYSTIVRIPHPYREWNQIATLPYGRDLYDLDISPDGRLLAGSMAEINGRQSLRLFPLETLAAGDTASRMLFDFGAAIPTSFVFSDDGERLYGSSYYTGVSNIFRYDLAADSMDVVTNAETGFFRPIPLSGDSLIVFRYSGAGFVPALIEGKPLTDVSAITFLGTEIVKRHPVLKDWKAPPPSSVDLDSLIVRRGSYSGFHAVRPSFVYPVIEAYKDSPSYGVRADFSDPIQMHSFDLSASHTPDRGLDDEERWHARIGYRRWSVGIKAWYNPASFYDLVGPFKASRKGYGGSLTWERTLILDTPRTLDLSVGIDGWSGLERLPKNQNVSTSPDFSRVVSGETRLSYKNLRAAIGAVDYQKGISWKLVPTVNLVRLHKEDHHLWRGFPQAIGSFDVGIPGPLRHGSVWLRTAAGYSPGDPEQPFANFFFGGFGNNYLDFRGSKRYREWWSYPGAPIDGIAGTSFTRAMIDVNLPPVRFRRLGTLDLFAAWARMSVFASGLVTDVHRDASRREVGSAGAQADLRMQLLTHHPLTLSVGYGVAFERRRLPTDEWMVSLKIL